MQQLALRARPAGPGRGRRGCPRATARAPRSATPSTRPRQSPSSGWWAGARTTITPPPAERSQPSSAARARMFSRSVIRRANRSSRKLATAASVARSGAFARSTSRPIRFATRRTSALAGSSAARAGSAGGRPPPRRPSARPSGCRSPRASTARSSSGDAQATASTPLGGVEHDHAGVERAGGRAGHRGRPAPDSTASETSSSASRNERSTGLAGLRPSVERDAGAPRGGRLGGRVPRGRLAASAADAIRRIGRRSRRPRARSPPRSRAGRRG